MGYGAQPRRLDSRDSVEAMDYRFRTVRDSTLRRDLGSDYEELQKALKAYLHKSALVLAGGIVEAVLINYLRVIGYRHGPKKTDPDRMSLEDLISACRSEGALSQETAALCTVMRGYRNLVHPGRILREGESPDHARAEVAAKAVERVLEDVHNRIRKRPEWAAERVLEEFDWPPPLKRTVEKKIGQLPEADLIRLLVDVLPNRAAEASCNDDEVTLDGCDKCFWAAFKLASPEARTKAAAATLGVIEATAPYNSSGLIGALFSAELLPYLDCVNRDVLISYVVDELDGRVRNGHWMRVAGLGSFLSESDVPAFIEALARGVVRGDDRLRSFVKKAIVDEAKAMSDECRRLALIHLDKLIESLRRKGKGEGAARLSEVRFQIEPLRDEDIPR